MSQSTTMEFCNHCGEMTPHIQEDVNHVLHLLLSLFTAGFWIPVWIIIVVVNANSNLQCTKCGLGG